MFKYIQSLVPNTTKSMGKLFGNYYTPPWVGDGSFEGSWWEGGDMGEEEVVVGVNEGIYKIYSSRLFL